MSDVEVSHENCQPLRERGVILPNFFYCGTQEDGNLLLIGSPLSKEEYQSIENAGYEIVRQYIMPSPVTPMMAQHYVLRDKNV